MQLALGTRLTCSGVATSGSTSTASQVPGHMQAHAKFVSALVNCSSSILLQRLLLTARFLLITLASYKIHLAFLQVYR